VSAGWEDVAAEWVAFVGSGEDVPFGWHGEEFLELVPPPAGQTLDAGCGEGRLARRLRDRGHQVVGVDASPTLVRLAAEADPGGDYRVADVTALPFADGTFGTVVSFMVLQDVENHEQAIREAARVLRVGGCLCLAIVHPVSSAGEWAGDELDAAHVVENYCAPFARPRPLGSSHVTQYHRPIAGYVAALSAAGFALDELRELATRRRSPGRIPVFLDIRAFKR
jgi:ubiquinone/menaquinone biosynthesis C-methylase UbiE